MYKMIVRKIVRESDRTVMTDGTANEGSVWEYRVIGKRDLEINIGDTIEHEPFGVNCGWFKRVIKAAQNG